MVSRAEAQALRCAASQCRRPLSRKNLHSLCWLNRAEFTSAALWRRVGRKPGWGRTAKNIMEAIERNIVNAKKEHADKKTMASLKRLLAVFVPQKKAVRKAPRGR